MANKDSNFAERVMLKVVKELLFLLVAVIIIGLVVLPFVKDKIGLMKSGEGNGINVKDAVMNVEHDDAIGYLASINGTVVNESNNMYDKVTIMYAILDENDAELGSAVAVIENVEPKGNGEFNAVTMGALASKPAKFKVKSVLAV